MTIISFKDYLSEQEKLNIDTDSSILESHVDKLNEDLDAITLNPFSNSSVFMNAIRGTAERYGIILPASVEMPMLSEEAETVYTLGTSGLYLYICHNPGDDNLVEGYAQIVDEEELDDLMSMDEDDEESEAETEEQKPWTPPARRDDDSGNDSEYA